METKEIATRHQYIRGCIQKTNREELIKAMYENKKYTSFIFADTYDNKFVEFSLDETLKPNNISWQFEKYDGLISIHDRTLRMDSFEYNCLTDRWGGVPEDHVHILKYDIFIPLFCKITEPFPLVSLWMEAKYEFITNTDPKMVENEDRNVVAYFWRFYNSEFFLDLLFENIKDNDYRCFCDKNRTRPLDKKNLQFIKFGNDSTDLNFIFYVDIDGSLCEFQYNCYLAYLRPIEPFKMITYQDEQFIDVRFYVLVMVNLLKGLAVIEMLFDPLKLE